MLDRDAEPNLVTRDIGRLVFGMDLQCCQCHDHPLIDDYYQDDYYGLFAFVHRTSLFTDAKSKLVSLDGEGRRRGELQVGLHRRQQRQGPAAAAQGGRAVRRADVRQGRGVRGQARQDRPRRAEVQPAGGAGRDGCRRAREFRRNLANRLWATMLGRGIVHPVDFHYAANPPAHPELLALLADELAKPAVSSCGHCSARLALTRAYQRSCDAPRPEIVDQRCRPPQMLDRPA